MTLKRIIPCSEPLKKQAGDNPSGPTTSEIDIDAEINFADITPKLTRILKQFEPFDAGYDSCVLTKHKDTGYAKKLWKNDAHLKLFVKQTISKEYQTAVVSGLGTKK
jgi:single-stranded-DNA-specific exonuclease